MMGRRRNGVRTLRNHSGTGNIADDFSAGQVSADSGFCPLTHFNFDGGPGFQIVLMDTETPGGNLNNGIFTVAVEVLMKSAFTGIIENTEFPGRFARAAWAL